MKNNKKNKKESFPDVKTPNPPQQMDPSVRPENNHPDGQNEDNNQKNSSDKRSSKKDDKKGKLLNEDAQINDETTI